MGLSVLSKRRLAILTKTYKPIEMNEKTKALAGLHIGVFLMGASGLFAKLVTTSAFFIVFGRVMFAAAALLVFQVLRRKKIMPESLHDAGGFVVLGALMAFHWYAFFHSIQLSTVAVGILTFSSFTVFVTLLEPLYFKTKLTTQACVTGMICCVGVGVIGGGDYESDQIAWGVIWGLLAGLSYAVMLLLNKNYVGRYSPITLTFYQCFVAMFVMLPIVLYMQEVVLPVDWAYLLVHGVICTALAFTLYVFSARHLEAQIISVVTMLEVLYGVVLAYLILGEALEVRMVAGGALILLASWLAMKRIKA